MCVYPVVRCSCSQLEGCLTQYGSIYHQAVIYVIIKLNVKVCGMPEGAGRDKALHKTHGPFTVRNQLVEVSNVNNTHSFRRPVKWMDSVCQTES